MRTILTYSLCFVAVLSAMWVTPPPVYAANVNYVPLAPIDVTGSEFTSKGYAAGNNLISDCIAPTCFPRYLRTLYNIGIVLAGLFAVVSIVRGGFTLMFTDSILGHSEGKGIILRALGGLLIVYSSYILMNLINPALGRDLDLALQFPRITIQEEKSTLTVVNYDEIERNFAKLRKDIADTTKDKERHEQDLKELEKAVGDAGNIPDPGEKERVMAELAKAKEDVEKSGRMITARQASETARNRIEGDFNSRLGLPSLQGIYRSRLARLQILQLEEEIRQAEEVLYDGGELAKYVGTQLTIIQSLVAAATSDGEKVALNALDTETRTLFTARRTALKAQIKNACDTMRKAFLNPTGCENYQQWGEWRMRE